MNELTRIIKGLQAVTRSNTKPYTRKDWDFGQEDDPKQNRFLRALFGGIDTVNSPPGTINNHNIVTAGTNELAREFQARYEPQPTDKHMPDLYWMYFEKAISCSSLHSDYNLQQLLIGLIHAEHPVYKKLFKGTKIGRYNQPGYGYDSLPGYKFGLHYLDGVEFFMYTLAPATTHTVVACLFKLLGEGPSSWEVFIPLKGNSLDVVKTSKGIQYKAWTKGEEHIKRYAKIAPGKLEQSIREYLEKRSFSNMKARYEGLSEAHRHKPNSSHRKITDAERKMWIDKH